MRPILLAMMMMMASAAAAQNAPRFTIAGEAFAQADIADARALPRIDATPAVLVTMDGKAVARLEAITRAHIGKAFPVMLDGQTVCEPVVQTAITDGAIEMPCRFATIAEAAAFARAISGKDPLPDSLEE